MSLQVWLPLNGNLNNQGLDGSLEFTNTASATVAVDGKIGSCYSFSATSGTGLLLSKGKSASEFMDAYINHHSWSMCAWVRTTSNDNVVFGLTYGLRLWCGSTNYVNLYNDTRNVSASNNISTIDGKWHHICATYNTLDNAVNVYVDGIKGTTSYYPSGETYASSWANSVAIGRDFNNSTASSHYYFQGSMNDVRIYDHCLSAKEVKEISKGLVCHYKLDNNGFGNPNLLITQSPSSFSRQGNKYINTVADSRTNDTFNLQYYRGSTHISTFFTKDVSTTPCDVKITFMVPENVTGLRVKFNGESRDLELFTSGRTPVVAGETYTLSLRVLSSKSEVVGGVQVENPKLEKGSVATPWCPHTSDSLYASLGLDSAIELDCSGLSNDGTKIGGLSPSASPLSARYESCYDFDGNTGSIQIPSLSTLVPSGEFTMNCWIYHDNTWSSEGYETIFGVPSGFELDAKHSTTNSPKLYACDWGKGSATYELNKWNMITMTRNASETKFYINGELKITGSAGNIPPGSYFIGAWQTSNGQNYKGKISDFRLYSTVLSVGDIRMLYNTSASVDKNGNMYAYEFKEE